MRQVARWTVFPIVLVGAVGVTLWGLERGTSGGALVFAIYLAMMPLVAVLERVLPYRREWNRSHDDLGTDAFYMAATWGLGALLGPLFAGLTVYAAAGLSATLGPSVWPHTWPLVAQVALACAVAEFFDYWAHRLLHRVPWLWRFHSIHHSARRVYWLNGTRSHPGEVVVRGLFGAIPLAALGVSEPVLALYMVLGRVAGLFQHANIDFALGPWSWIFSIGELHRWHHAPDRVDADTNYGNSFIVWDAVFGTRYLPTDRRPPANVGIRGLEHFPSRIGPQLLAPLRWRRLTQGIEQPAS